MGVNGVYGKVMGMGRGSERGVWGRMGRVNRVCGSECNVGFYGVWYEC